MKTILSLYDYTGIWSQPYKEAGYNVIQIDLKNGDDVRLFQFSQVASLSEWVGEEDLPDDDDFSDEEYVNLMRRWEAEATPYSTLFIGGSTGWKESMDTVRLIQEAQR